MGDAEVDVEIVAVDDTTAAKSPARTDSPEIFPINNPSVDDHFNRALSHGPSLRSRRGVFEPRKDQTYTIQQKDGTLAKGEVFAIRQNSRTQQKEYFVHYEGQNRRLDEWVGLDKFIPEDPIQTTTTTPLLPKPILKVTNPDDKSTSKKLTRSVRRIHDEINHVQPSIEDMDCTLAAMERLHEERTKVKYIDRIIFGRYDIDTWYFSPFPQEYGKQELLYICEFCMKYMKYRKSYEGHTCAVRSPPGRVIYAKDNVSMWEVDGKASKVYCQCLCLLSKLFLDHKTLYFDVDAFMFYILTETDSEGVHVVGYFSKEKDSLEGNNLACIMTLPPYQRKGYGKFLIGFSYELSKREKLIGSPEKPLSDLGKLSYRSYWSWVLLEILKDASTNMSIRELSILSCISEYDIIDTLQNLNLCKYWRGQHVLCVKPATVKACLESSVFQPPKLLVDPTSLDTEWKPPPKLPRLKTSSVTHHHRVSIDNSIQHADLPTASSVAMSSTMDVEAEPEHELVHHAQDGDQNENSDVDSDVVFEGDFGDEEGWEESGSDG